MLVFIRDLGSSLMYFGAFLALLYVATNRFSFVVAGLALFAGGAWFFAIDRRPRAEPHRHLARPVRAGPLRPGRRLLPDRQRAVRAGRRRAVRPGPGRVAAATCPTAAPLIPAPETDMIYAVIVNDLGLVGGCGRDRDLPADRRARLQDRDAGLGLVLEAARDRPDRGDGAAGVRDRRRRDPRDPADRRHAAVRLLRRLLDRGQLHPAGAAAADLRPRAPQGARGAG